MLAFLKSFSKTNFRIKVSFAALLAVFTLTPGMSVYENLTPHPQAPPVKTAGLTLPTPAPYPVAQGELAPALSAEAAIVIDTNSAAVLYEKNADALLLPASTTKIMTAFVALEHYNLTDVITVTQASSSIGQSMRLVRGETITVENLLYGLLVASGNDAAFALAQSYPGGYTAFVDKMNQKAQELHLTNTTFRNVSGVESYGHVTTVRDLSILAREAMKNPTFAQMVATPSITVRSSDGTIVHNLYTINELLGKVEGLKGIKTGWTENAGECLVTATERNGHEIITVMLGSEDRFDESQRLIEWAFANVSWENFELREKPRP
ncbi:MAG: D-alanyl-D-alanine carboxypeptidase [Candidatus Chisholmbacteria bacterium]|nr:D-alanyl-D-alanine carboxypeptidase [Candidatus Chisholmbacteria bacterium]